MFDAGGCSGRLRGCPFLGGRRALAAWGGFVWDAEMVFGARACFVERRTILHHPRDKRFGTPYVIAIDRYSSEARKENWIGWRYRTVETARDEQMASNSTERRTWWQVRSGVERIHFFMHTKS